MIEENLALTNGKKGIVVKNSNYTMHDGLKVFQIDEFMKLTQIQRNGLSGA